MQISQAGMRRDQESWNGRVKISEGQGAWKDSASEAGLSSLLCAAQQAWSGHGSGM